MPRRPIALQRQHASRAVCAALAIAVIGCGHTDTASAPPRTPAEREQSTSGRAGASPSSTSSNDAPDRVAHMQATFWLAVVARNSVIAGDLPAARRAADALARHDYAGTLPADWRHWVVQMQQRAAEVALAPDLASAARAVGTLALACGDCHAQMRKGDKPAPEPALAWKGPPEQIEERMERHAAGAELLWHGLVDPSERSWSNGTVTFTRAPLQPALHDGAELPPTLTVRIEEVRGMAERARFASSHPERAQVYGELIARCADCHYAVGPN